MAALVAIICRVALGRRQPARIVMTRTAISLPRSGWSDQEASLKYSDILDVYRSSWYSQSFINIIHRGGKHLIPISCLPSAQAFEEILSRLSDRLPSQ